MARIANRAWRVTLLCALLASGCAHPGFRGALVPASAPDFLPDWIFSESNWVESPSHIPGKFVRDIVIVRFVAGASQKLRQAAVDAVGGRVIGGMPFVGMEGAYYILLPTDPTNDRVFRAINTLESLPQIENALPDIIMTDGFGAVKKARSDVGRAPLEVGSRPH